MLTSLIRFAFICFLFSSAAVFSADNVTNSTEQVAPQNTSNTQLPEWFYRELTSIRKDVSVLDATGVSKEQIQELKERIGKVEVRLEESQLRVDGKLNEQSGRIGDLKDSYDSSLSQVSWTTTWFGIVAGGLGIVIAIVAYAFSWNARLAAIATAKLEAENTFDGWVQRKEDELTERFDIKLNEQSNQLKEQKEYHEKELEKMRDDMEEQAADNDINEAYSLAHNNRLDDALRRINRVIRNYENSSFLKGQRIHAKALYYKGIIFYAENQTENEISSYDELIKIFIESKDENIQELVSKGLINKGVALSRQNQLKEAIAVYDKLFSRFKDSVDTIIQEQVSSALINKAELVLVTQNMVLAKKVIQDANVFIKDSQKVDRAIMEMLKFIIEESTAEYLLAKVEEIPDSEIIGWRGDEIRPVIENLESPRREQVEAFARFFEEHKDKTKLKEELNQISKF